MTNPPIYTVHVIDGRGNIREFDPDDIESVDSAYALKASLERKHPNWTIRVKVYR